MAMHTMQLAQLVDELKRDEGVRLKMYKDSVGLWTIGVGRNIEERGISEQEAEVLLANDIQIALRDCEDIFDDFYSHPYDVQRALANMSFNLGKPTLSKFRNMIAAVDACDYALAADEAMDSRWAKQVGARAERIRDMLINATN